MKIKRVNFGQSENPMFEENLEFCTTIPHSVRKKDFLGDEAVPMHYADTLEILICENLDYRIIANETDLPVLVYATVANNIVNFPRFMARLMSIPNIIGVKFTIRDYFEMAKTKEINNGNINVINGPDETLLCGLAIGADGGIGSTYNLIPEWFVQLYNSFINKDIETAKNWQYRINRVIEALIRHSKNGAIKATKAALNLKGFDCGQAVFPASQFSHSELSTLKVELERLGIEF